MRVRLVYLILLTNFITGILEEDEPLPRLPKRSKKGMSTHLFTF